MASTLHGRDYFPVPGLPLQAWRTGVDADIAAHGHDFHELVLVVAGRALHEVWCGRRATASEVGPGDVFVLAPDEQHGYRRPRGFEVYNVIFTHELLAPDAARLRAVPGLSDLLFTEPLFRHEAADAPRLSLAPEALAQADAAAAALTAELAAPRPGVELAARGLLFHLLVQLARAWNAGRSGAGRDPALAAGQDAAVAAALDLIEARHGDEDLSIADLAGAAGLSPHWFSEVFRRRTGQSPWQRLTALRIERACALLTGSDLPITRIALDVGFGDPSYFARVFKTNRGCTPLQWRRRRAGKG